MHHKDLAHFVRARRPKLGTVGRSEALTLTRRAQHHSALAYRKLGMADFSVLTHCTETFREAEDLAEPVDRLGQVIVDKTGNDGSQRGRAIYNHCVLLPGTGLLGVNASLFRIGLLVIVSRIQHRESAVLLH